MLKPEQYGWVVMRPAEEPEEGIEEAHVIPKVDIRPHQPEDCPCNPSMGLDQWGVIKWSHNPFDGLDHDKPSDN